MTDAELLDVLDQIKQAPYPVFSAKPNADLSWISNFEGWKNPDQSDNVLYPTIREAIKVFIK